jgi:hypothetical protein
MRQLHTRGLSGLIVLLASVWALNGYATPPEAEIGQLQADLPIMEFPSNGFPSRVTLFSEAGLWGDKLTIEAPLSGPEETVRVLMKTQIENANLLHRISSVRLQCGSRKSRVVLFAVHDIWNQFADDAQAFDCDPGETVDINLHTEAPELADKVQSVFFVAHARQVGIFPFEALVRFFWNERLRDDPPSGGEAKGEPLLWLISTHAFLLRQNLELDHWLCGAHSAHMILHGTLHHNSRFSVLVNETYVDGGFGDAWSCRSKMESELADGAVDAAHDLEDSLNDSVLGNIGDHPRYYFTPSFGGSVRAFLLWYGGEPVVISK